MFDLVKGRKKKGLQARRALAGLGDNIIISLRMVDEGKRKDEKDNKEANRNYGPRWRGVKPKV